MYIACYFLMLNDSKSCNEVIKAARACNTDRWLEDQYKEIERRHGEYTPCLRKKAVPVLFLE